MIIYYQTFNPLCINDAFYHWLQLPSDVTQIWLGTAVKILSHLIENHWCSQTNHHLACSYTPTPLMIFAFTSHVLYCVQHDYPQSSCNNNANQNQCMFIHVQWPCKCFYFRSEEYNANLELGKWKWLTLKVLDDWWLLFLSASFQKTPKVTASCGVRRWLREKWHTFNIHVLNMEPAGIPGQFLRQIN